MRTSAVFILLLAIARPADCGAPTTGIGAAGGVIRRIGKFEIPRDDLRDVVELRGGDHCSGTIAQTSYRIQAPYGMFEFPAHNVAGLIGLSASGTRQLLVTTDGQAIAGRLDKSAITVQLESHGADGAQSVQVPFADMLRLGYRARPDEQPPAPDRPTAFLRAGDVLAILPPEAPVHMVTRYGVLEIPPQLIASIVFDSEDTGLHMVQLTDGSRFGALVESDLIPIRLKLSLIAPATGPATQATDAGTVRFQPGTISRLTFTNHVDKLDGSPTLKLANDDLLVGTLQGQFKLDTTLNTLTVDPQRVKRLTRTGDGSQVQVTFMDDTQLSGELEQPAITCRLQTGASVQIPIAQVREFMQPVAAPLTAPATAPSPK